MTPLDALVVAGLALVIFVGVVAVLALNKGIPRGQDAANLSPRVTRPGRGQASPRDPTLGAMDPEGHDTRRSTWNPYVSRPRRGGAREAEYRRRLGAAQRPDSAWNPFDEEQSISSRIRAARRKPRKIRTEPDYYELLGLERGASDAEIVRAYRRHAATIHPDRFYDDPVRRGQAEEKLKQLNKAMEVLRDPVARARYDAEL